MTIRNYPTNISQEKWDAVFGKADKNKPNPYSSANLKRKENKTAYIIPDNYNHTFVTEDITGSKVKIESRSQERRLMSQNKCRRYERGEKSDDKRIRYPKRPTERMITELR